MPKPGYYYYESKRALRVMVFLCIFALGLLLARYRPFENKSIWDLLHFYRWPISLCLFGMLFAYLFQQKFEYLVREPRPRNYRTRGEFLDALEKYRVRKRYMHGWVYYRSAELWPEGRP